MGEESRDQGVEPALEALQRDPRLAENVAIWRRLPARPAHFSPFPPQLQEHLVAALRRAGVDSLYTHQAAAVAAALRGEHVAVITPAASGKTLCYNVPVLHCLLADPRARALYLYPTKALAQDQLAALNRLLAALESSETGQDRGGSQGGSGKGRERSRAPVPSISPNGGKADLASAARQPQAVPLSAATYDGDTIGSHRARIRDGAHIILSNADMLHAGILPQHPRWAAFSANLRVVVIDEMHAYRGVFGSHVADVFRRLRRICRFYGATPQFLLASATIANPAELAVRLVEAPVTVVGPELNGAPQGERHILLYNPPLLDLFSASGAAAASKRRIWLPLPDSRRPDDRVRRFPPYHGTDPDLPARAARETACHCGLPGRLFADCTPRYRTRPALQQIRGMVATNALEAWASILANWRPPSWLATLAQLPAHGSRWVEAC